MHELAKGKQHQGGEIMDRYRYEARCFKCGLDFDKVSRLPFILVGCTHKVCQVCLSNKPP